MPSWALLFGARPLQCQDNVVTLGNLKSFSFDQLVKFNLQKCSSDSDCEHTLGACRPAARSSAAVRTGAGAASRVASAALRLPLPPAASAPAALTILNLCQPVLPPVLTKLKGSSAWLHTGGYLMRYSLGLAALLQAATSTAWAWALPRAACPACPPSWAAARPRMTAASRTSARTSRAAAATARPARPASTSRCHSRPASSAARVG